MSTASFASTDTFPVGSSLSTKGWKGIYSAPESSGTDGKLVVNSTALTAQQLSQIRFLNDGISGNNSSIQLLNKEIVAGD